MIDATDKIEGRKETPPFCNTEALNTSFTCLRSCIDWFGATFFTISKDVLITEILKLKHDDFIEMKHGKNGYRQGLSFGNIQIWYDGQPNMGVHVEMSGQGCREYESYGIQPWKTLFVHVVGLEGKMTRLDLAIDDFGDKHGKPYFTIRGIKKKIKAGDLLSKFRDAVSIEKIDIGTGGTKGETVYFGSGQSRIQIRMYEKNLEREGKGYQLEDGIKVWNRTEIQARDERAMKIAEHLVFKPDGEETIGLVASGILRNYLRFTDAGTDTNKSRRKTAPFWDKFLGDVEPLRLTNIAPDRTVQSTKDWMFKQVAPAIAMLDMAFEDSGYELYEELKREGADRLNKQHEDMLNRYRKEVERRKEKTAEYRAEQAEKRKCPEMAATIQGTLQNIVNENIALASKELQVKKI